MRNHFLVKEDAIRVVQARVIVLALKAQVDHQRRDATETRAIKEVRAIKVAMEMAAITAATMEATTGATMAEMAFLLPLKVAVATLPRAVPLPLWQPPQRAVLRNLAEARAAAAMRVAAEAVAEAEVEAEAENRNALAETANAAITVAAVAAVAKEIRAISVIRKIRASRTVITAITEITVTMVITVMAVKR